MIILIDIGSYYHIFRIPKTSLNRKRVLVYSLLHCEPTVRDVTMRCDLRPLDPPALRPLQSDAADFLHHRLKAQELRVPNEGA